MKTLLASFSFAPVCSQHQQCAVLWMSANVHPAMPVLLLRAVPNLVRHGHAGGKAHGDVCVAAVWALRLAGCQKDLGLLEAQPQPSARNLEWGMLPGEVRRAGRAQVL